MVVRLSCLGCVSGWGPNAAASILGQPRTSAIVPRDGRCRSRNLLTDVLQRLSFDTPNSSVAVDLGFLVVFHSFTSKHLFIKK